MKKIISVLLCGILFISISANINANAANINSKAGLVTTSSSSLNIRSSPNTYSSVVGKLEKGAYVTLVEKNGQWWKVEYQNGMYGYCSATYITEKTSSAAKVSITSGYLNIRAGAGTWYGSIGRLYNNAVVIILSENNGWSKILFNGTKIGYASSKYLTKQSSSNSSAVKLNVPDYKQTDKRWSGVYLGSSGKTIGNIGCTTTCLAMTESYRTGSTIYPNAMAKKLSYSPSGSLYWPSNYTVKTTVTFGEIKTLLKKNKPVILGLKTDSGSTHWVVVTGFDNTYFINDPGSSQRTLLKEALQKYPYFYKMAYYN